MDKATHHRLGLTARAAWPMAILLLTGCGTTAGRSATSPTASAAASSAYPPETSGTASPTSAGTGQPTRPATAACPMAGTTAEPYTSCTVTLRIGARLPVLLRTPYPNQEAFRIAGITGSSTRVNDRTSTQAGDTRFVLIAVRAGTTRITASCPGPHSAPGIGLTITGDVSE
ncbi:hypothetical protein ACJ6WF_31355 [Streptomyces sp. MMS24-I2-30]|uniref:hypothetical protein n=1 Tax=Streptomyces sp. MMS24-I2-30 TaxID=3351564 RepID=UPI0038969966